MSMTFQVIPAIDLIDGQVVRLTQGERDRATYYPDPPAKVAARFIQAGSRWLHIVNLDGAFDQDDNTNQTALVEIAAQPASIQFGGGLRSLAAMRAALARGVDRMVVGTLALKDQSSFEAALAEFGPGRLAVAIDVRDNRLQTHGWTADAPLELEEFLTQLAGQGIEWIIYTDADRDGTGAGLAVKAARRIQAEFDFKVIVSGGVGSLDDIRAARRAELAGVIVGKALHDEVFTIEEALTC